MKKIYISRVVILLVCFLLSTPGIVSAVSKSAENAAQAGLDERDEAKPWWKEHLVRIHHPNVSEYEFQGLDVKRFIADCKAVGAEAIVVSAAGIYAFYPSKVPNHYISPVIGKRDLVGEIVAEAHTQGLRVIARVDFGKARESVLKEHPEWFRRDANGQPVPARTGYRTCPVGGYQNEEFAHPVVRELLTNYKVDGIHVNSSGFYGYCYCNNCATAFGEPIPTAPQGDSQTWDRFLHWREEAISSQLAELYRVISELNPEALFMGELAGPQNPDWTHESAFDLPSMTTGYTNYLFSTGRVAEAREFRWWVGLAARQGRATGSKGNPIINIKMPMRDLRLTYAFMPPAEFSFYSYQAMAHGSGLKLPTFPGLLQNQLDPRVVPALTNVFSFMRQQREVLDTMKPNAPVALVWPEQAFFQAVVQDPTNAIKRNAAKGLRNEFLGLYSALTARHVQFGLLYDEHISTENLKRYEAVVLPTAVWLSDQQAKALASFVRGGGRLVLLDSPAATYKAGQHFRPMPSALAKLIGGKWSEKSVDRQISTEREYALPTTEPLPAGLQLIGPVGLTMPYRRIKAGRSAQIWLRGSTQFINSPVSPERQAKLEAGKDPVLLMVSAGKGHVAYMATGLGQMAFDIRHPDYASILEAMLYNQSSSTPTLLTDAPSSVEVTLARYSEGMVIHLLNTAGPAPLDEPAIVGPIELDLAWDGPALARLFVPGAAPIVLRGVKEAGRIKIEVPHLAAYAQVVLNME